MIRKYYRADIRDSIKIGNISEIKYLFYKPSFLGKDGIPLCTARGVRFIEELKEFKIVRTEMIDNNILIELANGEPICLLD